MTQNNVQLLKFNRPLMFKSFFFPVGTDRTTPLVTTGEQTP